MTLFVDTSLKYSEDLSEYYQKLSNLPGFVLLESADKAHGRYDILSAYPYERIRVDNGTTDFTPSLNQLADICSKESTNLALPFQGGALGYISYDFGARLLGIDTPTSPHLGGMPLLDLGLYDWALITDHHLKRITLFAANKQTETKAYIAEVKALWQQPLKRQSSFLLNKEFNPSMSESKYMTAIDEILDALNAGRCYQVNFTQSFLANYTGDPWEMYKKISKHNPVPFAAFLRTDDADILSFSPERFMFYEHGKILTSPIKGTIGRSVDKNLDAQLQSTLSNCPKNRAENVMIVDLCRNDLGKIAKPGSVKVTNLCEVQSYRAVHHLVSDVVAECREDVNPITAFLSCFPGGSITGAPKLEAMKMIQELEWYGRGIYCGSIGYFSNHGRFDTNIAIRTLTARAGNLHLAAGGGIVIDSIKADEYQECFTKIAAITHGLKL